MKNASNDWSNEFLLKNINKDVEGAWTAFKEKMYSLRDEFVPKTTITGNPTWQTKGNIPICKPLQEAIQRKAACHRKWRKSKSGMWNKLRVETIQRRGIK